MGRNRRKWYVVFNGPEPGICDSWEECLARVNGVSGVRYKSYDTQEDATLAFRDGEDAGSVLRAIAHGPHRVVNYTALPGVVADSVAVDAACSGNPGLMEYRCVDVPTGAELFHQGPFPDATNNVGEFLALVHALALMVKQGNDHTAIYSDSRVAQLWVRMGKCRTTLKPTARNAYVLQLVARAEAWLATHEWPNQVLKWNTEEWGEIPADFGRK